MQKPSGTFKTTLALVIGAVAVLLILTAALAYFLVGGGPAAIKRPAAHGATAAAQAPAVPAAPAPPTVAPVVGDAVLFKVRASVSSDDGTDVSIEATPTTEPCVEPRWLDARKIHIALPSAALKVDADASWCLRVTPSQHFTPETLNGRWATLTDRVLSVDAAHQYMRVQHASGRWLGIRAIAAGYCASERSACSGTALVEVSVDDRNLIVPMAISSHGREVLRLTSEGELPRASSRAGAPTSDADAPTDMDATDTDTYTPADAPAPAPVAPPAPAPAPMPDFVR